MKSFQETYVKIKYWLENNGFEPKLNDMGVRRNVRIINGSTCSEPS